ncbi:outer membrane beta-barrel protein [Roseivirga misakiensis]|uniref:Outer membrane protein beta-barrel domain-containing protein n=1 Tax=Roseivirga misakiensis TaxID=1563681 RepID=A0A1E5T6N7_9BACT|nr:outer membrane beta-barrel protein [Roseivirga misakiensis]OEK07006.1 hypothetical protein BFP71_04930 [Roseivirga misakiensis]
MKKFILITIVSLFCFSFQAQAQKKVPYIGQITDTLGVPLQFANILAMDTVKNSIAAFGVTDPRGNFRLTLQEGKAYKIKISFIGFLPVESMIKAYDNTSAPLSIALRENSKQLGDVEVVTEMPVLIQGDTITYKADVFTKGNERKLGDVLNELPGFEVNEDGQVKVEGQTINKLMVDGKEAFGGDTKLMTKNLPANVVDKVQLLKNFNDVAPLSSVNQSEAMALNIMLKEDKKNILFGDLTAGAGPENRYLGHANAFYYSPKTSLNFIGGANNVGKLTFTMSDYFRFSGGLGGFAGRSGSGLRLSSNNLGFPVAERNNAQELKNETLAFNFNSTPSKSWNISGFAIGSKVNNTLGSVSRRNYILQTGDNQEILTSATNTRSNAGLFKFNTKYTPNPLLQVGYDALVRISDSENITTQNSEFGGINNAIGGVTAQQPWSIQNQLSAFYAADDKNVLSLEASYEYKFQDPLYDLSTSERPFASLITLSDDNPFNILQSRVIKTNNQEAILNYYRILNKTNHINLSVGNVYTEQSMTSDLVQLVNDNEFDLGNPDLINDVDYRFQDYYAGVTLKTKFGRLLFTPSLNLHYYQIENVQRGTTERFDKTLLLPSVSARYKFSSSHSLSFNYNPRAEFTDIQNLARGLIVRSYNSLFGGNPILKNSFYHNLSMNYSNFSMYSFFNLYGGLNYSKRFDDVSNIIQFNGLERVNTPINIDVANETMSGNINADKRFDSFSINFSGRVSRSISNNFIGDILNENVSFQQTYTTGLSTTFFKKLNIDIGVEKTFNRYDGNNISNRFENDKPFIKMDVRFLKGFRLDVDYEYNNYQNKANDIQSDFEILDVELTYRKGKSPWEFRVEGMNLLNTTGIRRDSFSESLISTYEYFIQKRYWLLSIVYDL